MIPLQLQNRAIPSSPSSKPATSIRSGTATSASRRSRRRPRDAPMHWRWRDFEPLAARAAKEVLDRGRRAARAHHGESGLRRRNGHDHQNLIARLHHPRARRPRGAAPSHRAAIRFSTRAEGAVTIVNGRRCEMKDGDLVLTPPMCWHGHINESDHRTYLVRRRQHAADLRARREFLRAGRPATTRSGRSTRARRVLDRSPAWAPGDAGPRHSPKYRYPGEETRRLLAALPAGAGRRADDPLRQSADRRRR